MVIDVIVMAVANVKMRLLVHATLLSLLIMECYALTCRSAHGAKDEELRRIFNNCLKQENGENKRQSTSEHDRNQQNQWEKDNKSENREETMSSSDIGKKERSRNKNTVNNNARNDGIQNGMNENRETDERYNTNGRREDRIGNINGMRKGADRGTNDMVNSYGTPEHLRGQDEFLQSEEYNEASRNNYYPSVKPPRRYKREKSIEMNSGQRSQYNPHSQRNNAYNENNHENEERKPSNNSSKEIDKACVLHCFMENLHMTGDNGMPDRFLVTHALTKDEKNEDLRDFLQESIEECFQILDNESTEDKCEFSKNLLTCLSEKARANCDDWNGKSSLLF